MIGSLPRVLRCLPAAVALTLAAGTLHGQETLGTVTFPASGAPAAQPHFIRGVLLLHSFEYGAAAAAFRTAQQLDPGFVMAYWGEAMSYTHPIWNEQDITAARSVLRRLAPTPAGRQARAPTPRERGYLEAVEVLYGDGAKSRRDTLYAAAMERLARAYPEDLEAKAFHALALLGLSQGERDVPTYMRAAALAQDVFDRNRDHPGGAHYLIHSFDDPVHAPLGLIAARAYATIAPDAAHAQHMTTHIFVAMGMWDDVVAANERAVAVVERAAGRAPVGCGHYNEWLAYGYLQEGRTLAARRLVEECRAEAAVSTRRAGSLADMRATYLVDTGEWSGAEARAVVDTAALDGWGRSVVDFTAGLGAASVSDARAARRALVRLASRHASLPQSARGNAQVMAGVLGAAILFVEGHRDEAIAEASRAAQLEASLPFAFGPPAAYKPPRELEGELLLAMDRPRDAVRRFEEALRRTPGRTLALLGLARAAAAAGEVATAREAYEGVVQNLARAEPEPPALAEARRYLEHHQAGAPGSP